MIPSETWVIYDKYDSKVVWVTCEMFLAQRRWDKMVEEEIGNLTPKLVSNKNKLVVTTLERALSEIEKEFNAKIESITQQREQESRWLLTDPC